MFVRILILMLMLAVEGTAQLLTKDEITARIEAAKVGEESGENAEAAQIWSEALSELQAADGARQLEGEARKQLDDLGKELNEVPPEKLAPGATLKELQEFRKRVEELVGEKKQRAEALAKAGRDSPKLTVALAEEKEQLESELRELTIPPLGSDEIEAAEYQKAIQSKNRIEAKLAEVGARQALNEKEADLYNERITAARKSQVDLQNLLNTVEERITTLKAEKAEDTRSTVALLEEEFNKQGLGDLAEIVSELKAIRLERDRIEKLLVEAKDYDDRVDGLREDIEREFKRAEERIGLLEEAGLGIDDETGVLLRRQRAKLPSVDEISTELRSKLEVVARAEISLLEVNEQLKNLSILSEDRIEEIERLHPRINRQRIEDLLKRRSDALGELSREYRRLNEELTKGTIAAKRTVLDIQVYSAFIDERLLWIKSAKPFSWREPIDEWRRILTLFSPGSLAGLADSIRKEFVDSFLTVFLGAIVVLAIFWRRRRLLEILKTSSDLAERRNCTNLRPTLDYIGAAFLLSLQLPLVVWVISELVVNSPQWRSGLYRLSSFLALAFLFLKFSRPRGLFECHFRVGPGRSSLFYHNLQWLILVAPVFVFLVSALTSSETDPAAGRTVFIAGMVMIAIFCHAIFLPKRSILQRERKSTGFTKASYVMIMLCPVLFVIGAILGYFESVLILRDQAGATAVLLLSGFLASRFLTRWILVSRRRLAIKQAMRRRDAMLAERERGEQGGSGESEVMSLEEVKAEAVDVVEVQEQTTKLLKIGIIAAVFFGLWGIWSSTLPALSILDKVELWREGSTTETVSRPAVPVPRSTGTADGEGPVGLPAKIIPKDDGRVTLQDLLLTVVFLALTFVAASNIPGLLSLTVFNRIRMGPGGNFALTTTFRYLIVLTGVVIALGQIGITWGKLQWLAAAVSLGIGFGLQEIIANFVAGIILLFERPIRLGDIVTVGDISGKVTQIKIRATTIQQFNNRELLVPNKEFITSQLVNWTLNDSVLRLEIPVGIAYGSDTRKATRILEEVLHSHPNVMTDPAPAVFFLNFGNSTLDFEARCFVASVDVLLSTKSELHYRIDEAFREAGIEIAFPQQDVHLRSVPNGMKLSGD